MKKKLISLLTAVVMLISMTALNVSAATFEISTKKITGSTDNYTADVTFEGRSGLLKFQNNTLNQIEYQNIGMTNAYIKANKYMLVDCYLDDAAQETFGLTIQFCKLDTAGWVFLDTNANRISDGHYHSAATYPANKWVTVAIDCSEVLSWIDTTYPTDRLNQFRIKNIPTVSGDAAFYVGRVRFHHDIVEPLVYTDDEGNQYTYLSEDGKVTVDGLELDAFKTTSEAFAALGTAGGTVYLDGALTAFSDATTPRGHILLRGIGDTEEDIARNVIKGIDRMEIRGGDFTLDYITVEAYKGAETGQDYTSIYTYTTSTKVFTLEIGANVVSTGLATGSRLDNGDWRYPLADKIIINGGRFYSVTPLSNYGARRLKRNGSIEYTINGGEINALMAGSNNTWEWDQSEIRGDVIYTVNGGLFTNHMIMGSAIAQTAIEGNIIWTVNDGWMDGRRIVGGNAGDAKKDTLHKTLNNVAAIVNLKGEKEGLATLTLGTDGAKGKDISGNEIYILNNNEDNLGTKIADGSLAEYKMHVYYGKAEPVFAKDKTGILNSGGASYSYGGALTGFTLTPDEEGAVPYLNGTALTPNENGLYEIPADANNVMEIIFAKSADSKLISFKATDTKAEAKIYNFTDSVMPMRVYVAQYEDGKLISVKSEARRFEKSDKVQTVGVDFEKAEGYTYRAFLWNDMTSLADDMDL